VRDCDGGTKLYRAGFGVERSTDSTGIVVVARLFKVGRKKSGKFGGEREL